jgi:hypothetical protein
MVLDSDWPLTGITLPGDNDVVVGRGGASIHHPGNVAFRNLVRTHQPQYIGYDHARHMKTLLSVQVVRKWRMLSPPGRFLKKDDATGIWSDVGDNVARRKTAQLLREGVKMVRRDMRATGELSGSSEDEEDTSCLAPPLAKRVKTCPEAPTIVNPELQKQKHIANKNGMPLLPQLQRQQETSSRIVKTMRSAPATPTNSSGMTWKIEMELLSNDLRATVRSGSGRKKMFLYGEPKTSLEMLEHILGPILEDDSTFHTRAF